MRIIDNTMVEKTQILNMLREGQKVEEEMLERYNSQLESIDIDFVIEELQKIRDDEIKHLNMINELIKEIEKE